MIKIRTLGPVEVTVDGEPAPPELRWRRNLALLVYLARSPKHVRTRDHLVGLLWPDKSETAARHSLREAVRVLRRSLGDETLETSGQQVRLEPDRVQLDVDELAAAVECGDLARATQLAAGEFMEGFAVPAATEVENWLAAERSAWRGRAVDALIRYARSLIDRGALSEAADVGRRALAIDGGSEVALRTVMRTAALLGDRAGALAALDLFASRQQEETGAEPGRETVALADRIRRERLPTPSVTPSPDLGAESRHAPLIGRSAEMEHLSAAWQAVVREGRSAMLLVEGDFGYGKTRLLDELARRAALEGAVVSVVRAVQADVEDAFSGLLGLARGGVLSAPGLAAAPPGALHAFASRLQEWADRFPVAPDAVSSLDHALREVVAAVAVEQPLLLAVDDAQWLDRDSWLGLEALLRDLDHAPVAVALAATSHPVRAELDTLRAHVGRDTRGTVVSLAPLEAPEIRALCQWALPDYDDEQTDRVTRRVMADSAGLPLLAVELVHAISLGLDLAESDAAWPKPLQTLAQSLPSDLPDAVVAAIRIGFRRLSKPAQTVLAAASVLGDRIAPERVARATHLQADPLERALDELEWARWLTAEPRGYAFVARIVQKVIARDMLTEGQRRRLLAAADR